jgi:hypothetical protein
MCVHGGASDKGDLGCEADASLDQPASAHVSTVIPGLRFGLCSGLGLDLGPRLADRRG